jgi:toxin ParE1/3/4
VKVRWLPVAAESRRRQIDYIGWRNPRAALDAGDRIRATIRLLSQHPAIGRSGRRDGTRELVVARTPFLLVYRVESDVITILRLFHGAQDWPNLP